MKGPLMPTPDIDISELRKLEAAATQAPWLTLENHTRVYVGAENKTVVITGSWSVAWKPDDGLGDSKFIAALRNAAPALLGKWEECEALRRSLQTIAAFVRESNAIPATHSRIIETECNRALSTYEGKSE